MLINKTFFQFEPGGAGWRDHGRVQRGLGRPGREGEAYIIHDELWPWHIYQEPDDEIIKSGVKPDNIRKWKVLQSLQDRNETLFYRWVMSPGVNMMMMIIRLLFVFFY